MVALCHDKRISAYTYEIHLDARYKRPMIASEADAARTESMFMTMVRGFNIPAERIKLVLPLVKEEAVMRHVRGKFAAQMGALVREMAEVREHPCRELCITQYMLGECDWRKVFKVLGATCARLETLRLCGAATVPVAEAPTLGMSDLLAVDWAAYERLCHFDIDFVYDRLGLDGDADRGSKISTSTSSLSHGPPPTAGFKASTGGKMPHRGVNCLALSSSTMKIFLEPSLTRTKPDAQRQTIRRLAADLLRLCGRWCRFTLTVYAEGTAGAAVKPAGLKFARATKHRTRLRPRDALKEMLIAEIEAMRGPMWEWLGKTKKGPEVKDFCGGVHGRGSEVDALHSRGCAKGLPK
jgi:hypothetical protein